MAFKNSSQVSQYSLIWKILRTPRLLKSLFRYLFYVSRDFFWMQFETRLFPQKRPVVNVDHPLDDSIPYRQNVIDIYLSFIPLWIKALSYLNLVLGKGGTDELVLFLDELTDLYIHAGTIYTRSQSTTRRPRAQGHPRFLMIHITDPHYHCVPSLHVMIVCYVYYQSKKILERNFPDQPNKYLDEVEYLYSMAVSITETILLVKQHSVNCISAALICLTERYEDFTAEFCRDLITDLFDDGLEQLKKREEIIYHITSLFNQMETDRRQPGASAKSVILGFLEDYSLGKIPNFPLPEKVGC